MIKAFILVVTIAIGGEAHEYETIFLGQEDCEHAIPAVKDLPNVVGEPYCIPAWVSVDD